MMVTRLVETSDPEETTQDSHSPLTPLLDDLSARLAHLSIQFQIQSVVDDLCFSAHQSFVKKAKDRLRERLEDSEARLEHSRQILGEVSQKEREFATQNEKVLQESLSELKNLETEARELDIEIEHLAKNAELIQKELEPSTERPGIFELPLSIQKRVFNFLGTTELCCAIRVCHAWRNKLDVDEMWKDILQKVLKRKKEIEKMVKERVDPTLNRLSVHLELPRSGISKEGIFQQCLKKVNDSATGKASHWRELQAEWEVQSKKNEETRKKLQRSRKRLKHSVEEKEVLECELRENKKNMSELAEGVMRLENELQDVKKEISQILKLSEESKAADLRQIETLNNEIKSIEEDEEFSQLLRNRKILVDEIQFLRNGIEHEANRRDKALDKLNRVKDFLSE